MNEDIIDINLLKQELKQFVVERDWLPAHTIKNLVMNLSVEANELQEIFVWHDEQQIKQLVQQPDKFEHIREELGDVMMTVVMLADQLGINIKQAITDKLTSTKQRYPARASK